MRVRTLWEARAEETVWDVRVEESAEWLKAEMSGFGQGEMGGRDKPGSWALFLSLSPLTLSLTSDWNCKMVGLSVGGWWCVSVSGWLAGRGEGWVSRHGPLHKMVSQTGPLQQHSDTPHSHARYSNAANVVLGVSLPPLHWTISDTHLNSSVMWPAMWAAGRKWPVFLH